MTVILAYVPGPDYNLAADRIADFYHRAVTRTGEQPVFLLGDFNRCDVTTMLPNLEKYVTFPTRLDRMLDLCYGNIPGAYISKARPPLGRSGNVILLLPRYRQKLKTDKIQTKIIKTWDNDSTETLRGCLELTDWDVFFKNNNSESVTRLRSISSYLTFCTNSVIPSKQVRLYPNLGLQKT